ncbi:MAG TPA: hypothetical protein VF668_01730, partial [Pyrinomonadaceae bacterium]
NIIRAVGAGPAPAPGEEKPAAPARPAERVLTLAGGDLFEFGDRDGEGDDARFQHPLGLALHDGRLLVADTYNHKIRSLDPRTRRVTTFVGTGKAGQADGARAEFYEPGGLSVARGKLYVADTNNHAVRVVDLATKRTTTLVIRGLEPPPAVVSARAADEDASAPSGPNAEEFKAPAQRLAVGAPAEVFIEVSLPEGYHLNPSAPHRYSVEVGGRASKSRLKALPLRVGLEGLPVGASELRAAVTVYYCREDNTGTCRVKTLVWRAPVELTDDPAAPREVRLKGKVE